MDYLRYVPVLLHANGVREHSLRPLLEYILEIIDK